MAWSEQAAKNSLANLIGYGFVDPRSLKSCDFKSSFHPAPKSCTPGEGI